jgi:hypothetical protein
VLARACVRDDDAGRDGADDPGRDGNGASLPSPRLRAVVLVSALRAVLAAAAAGARFVVEECVLSAFSSARVSDDCASDDGASSSAAAGARVVELAVADVLVVCAAGGELGARLGRAASSSGARTRRAAAHISPSRSTRARPWPC